MNFALPLRTTRILLFSFLGLSLSGLAESPGKAEPFRAEIEFQAAVVRKLRSVLPDVVEKLVPNPGLIAIGPEEALDDLFANYNPTSNPDTRFLVVLKDAAFVGLFPQKRSQNNLNELCFSFEVSGLPKFYLEYKAEGLRDGHFLKVAKEKQYECEPATVAQSGDEKARQKLERRLVSLLTVAHQAVTQKKISRGNFRELVALAAGLAPKHPHLRALVKQFRK
jgi:hypothetical protein